MNENDGCLPTNSQDHESALSEQTHEDDMNVQTILAESATLKDEATRFFRKNQWNEALERYQLAFQKLPSRDSESDAQEMSTEGVAMARATLNGNIAACYFRMVRIELHKLSLYSIPFPKDKFSEAAKSCTEALKDNPDYIKVLRRRADCNEKIGTWSSLTQAQNGNNCVAFKAVG
jgi:tetratricopeptide (TPR) repeat protein